MIKMVFKGLGLADQACELPDGTYTVGRCISNALKVQEDSVSGRHCVLLVYGTELIVRDCGSRNGTFVDGMRVQGQCGVRNGQIIRFGRVEAEVQIERSWELEANEVSTVQGLLQAPNIQREVQREWIVTPATAYQAKTDKNWGGHE